MTFAVPIIQFDFTSPKADDIKRCLYALYQTVAGTQPLDREFGLNIDFLDYPAPIAKNMYALEVISKTKRYEPRAAVISITYKDNANPEYLYPVILIGRGEAYE